MKINCIRYINFKKCSFCRINKKCFLINGNKLSQCLRNSQNVIVSLMSNAFEFKWDENIWHGNLDNFDAVFANYFATYGGWVPANIQPCLSLEEQNKSDLKYIKETLKKLLTAASKATKDNDPISSIMFDGIGLVLASDYMEAVDKVISMISTAKKI